MPVNLDSIFIQPTITSDAKTKKQAHKKTNKSSISPAVKVVIFSGLAALAAGGIYIATRGKSRQILEEPKNSKNLAPAKETLKEAANTLKELTTKAFKEEGKFIKGRAITKTGQNYSGNIVDKMEDGSILTKTYNNGLLQRVVKNKDNITITKKEYKYDNNRVLSEITIGEGKLLFKKAVIGDKIRIKTPKSDTYKDVKSGKILQQYIKGKGAVTYNYDKNGNLEYVKHELHNGKSSWWKDLIYYYPDGKTVRCIDKYEDDISYFYDKNGKLVDQIKVNWDKNSTFTYNSMTESGPHRKLPHLKRKYELPDGTTIWKLKENPDAKIETLIDFGDIDYKDFKVRFKPTKEDNSTIIWHNDIKMPREGNEIKYDNLVEKALAKIKETSIISKRGLKLRNEILTLREKTKHMRYQNVEIYYNKENGHLEDNMWSDTFFAN